MQLQTYSGMRQSFNCFERPRARTGSRKSAPAQGFPMRQFIVRIATLAGLAVFVTSGANAQNPVRIGMVMPMTGTLANAGKQVVAGARLYVREHGDTVAGRKVELLVKDTTSSFDVGKRLIQESIVNDKVDIIGGGLTGDLFAAAGILTEARTPTVIMLSSTSAVIDKSPFFVRTSCTLAQSSAIMADWAVRSDIKRVVTLVSDFSPGHEAEASFKDRYLSAGGAIAEAIRVPLQNPDFAPFLQRARDAAPQAIFVFIPSVQAGTFARQFVERGLDKAGIRLLGPGDLTDDELLPSMGDAMLGTVTAHFYSAAHPATLNSAFVDGYQKQYGVRPNFMAVSGYDGMHLIYEALRMTGGSADGQTLVAAMKGMAWASPRGPMSTDPRSGDVIHNIYIRKVEKVNGALQNVEFETFEAVRDIRTAAR
jgi:branched-chain amino acid transport system substrate-binding protein